MADPLYDPSIEPRVRKALTSLRRHISKGKFDLVVRNTVSRIGRSRDYEATVETIRREYKHLTFYLNLSEEQLDAAAAAVIAAFPDGFPSPTPAELERRRQVEQESEIRRARPAARRASPPRGVHVDVAEEVLGDLGGRFNNASRDGYYTDDIVPAVQRNYGQQYHLSDDDMYDQDDEDTPHEYVIVRVRSPSRYRY